MATPALQATGRRGGQPRRALIEEVAGRSPRRDSRPTGARLEPHATSSASPRLPRGNNNYASPDSGLPLHHCAGYSRRSSSFSRSLPTVGGMLSADGDDVLPSLSGTESTLE